MKFAVGPFRNKGLGKRLDVRGRGGVGWGRIGVRGRGGGGGGVGGESIETEEKIDSLYHIMASTNIALPHAYTHTHKYSSFSSK